MNPNLQKRDPVQAGIRIQIDATAMQKLWLWTEMAKGEVSALGLVDEIRDAVSGTVSSLLVTDFFLVKQACSSDETTMDPQSVAELMASLETKGVDCRKLRCWAHSHGTMSVFWSATDHQCVGNLANGEWLLSIVVNKKRDAMVRLDQFNPAHLYLTDVVWEVRYPLVDGLAEECLKEFKAKVKEGFQAAIFTRDIPRNLEELKDAYERGALTEEDLEEELWWENVDKEELGIEKPF
jgi:hypothetical protein